MTCHYAKLTQEALIHLQGTDALSFLQGQVTCDTRKLGDGNSLPGVLCTVQGRVVGDFLLFTPARNHLVLRLRRDIRGTVAAVLGKYIIFSRAQLESEREDWQVLACWGSGSGAALRHIFGNLPGGRYGARVGDGFTIVQTDDAGQQFECYLRQDAAADFERQLAQGMDAAAEAEWRALQIAAGIARIEAGSSGEFIPQMLNYDVTGHISFNKGCYTGQEVVARMHYRGKSKRRLYRAALERGALPAGLQVTAGDPLFGGDSSQAAGNVVNAVATGDGKLVLLVTATASGIENGLHLSGLDEPLLRTETVPYPVPEK